MVKLEVGKSYGVIDARSGEGSKGAYYFFPIKAPKGYDKITVWAANPEAAKKITGAAKIASVKEVTLSATKKDTPQGTKWYTNYNVTAELEQGEMHESADDVFDADEAGFFGF